MNEEPQIIECERLKARVSPLQCLSNRLRALVLSEFPNIGAGMLKPCRTCPTGRRVRAYLPEGGGE